MVHHFVNVLRAAELYASKWLNSALKIVMMVKKKTKNNKNVKAVNVMSCIFYHG